MRFDGMHNEYFFEVPKVAQTLSAHGDFDIFSFACWVYCSVLKKAYKRTTRKPFILGAYAVGQLQEPDRFVCL